MEKFDFQITKNSYWFWWEPYIQFEFDIQMEVKGLKYQINALNEYLKSFDSETKKVIEKLKKQPESTDLIDYIEDIQIEQSCSKSFLISSSLESNCLIIYSYLEKKLLFICELLQKEFNINKKINKVNASNTLEKYWIFLKDFAKLNLEDITEKYNHISSQRLIRNSIAHQGNGTTRKKASSAPGLEINGCNFKIKDESYLIYLLELTEAILQGLLKTIAVKKYEIKQKNNS